VELTPEEKMHAAQGRQDKWSKVAADPSLSPRAAAWAQGLARSAAAEVVLRQKAASVAQMANDPISVRRDFRFGPPSKIRVSVLATMLWWGGIAWGLLVLAGFLILCASVWWYAGFWALLVTLSPFTWSTWIWLMILLVPGWLLMGLAGHVAETTGRSG
jgi:hypothetical protein